MPDMGRAVQRAELYENNDYVANPYLLVQRLLSIFTANGGEFLKQRVNGVSRSADGRYRIITTYDDLSARRLVVCSGAWSKRLLSRSEEHTSELQSLMRISYAVFCLKKKKTI